MNTLRISISLHLQSMLHNSIDHNIDDAMNKIHAFEDAGLAKFNDISRTEVFTQLKKDVVALSDRSAKATTLSEVATVYATMCKFAWTNRRHFDDIDASLNLHYMYGEMFNIPIKAAMR